LSGQAVLPLTLAGVGLHSGEPCAVHIHPRGEGGIVFQVGSRGAPARWQNVSDSQRCTQLCCNGIAVRTIEHLMAAFLALDLGCALVQVEGPELPAAGGNAEHWVQLLQHLPTVPQWERRRLRTTTHLEVGDSFYGCRPASELRVAVAVSYPGTVASWQVAAWDGEKASFTTSIAPARTFCLASEYEQLVSAGLAQGGAAQNGFLLDDGPCLEHMRFSDEPARHKLLDLIGDLALLGFRPKAEILAVRPGHALNRRLCETIASAAE
jgi:UDP-3-O-acyl N-acetylglucosamine deacetylase